MIACNPRVYIESGNGTVENIHAVTEDGWGVLFVNSTDRPHEIGSEIPLRANFKPEESAITWAFKSIKSLDVLINNLNKLRNDMEAYAKGELNKEMNHNG